MNMLGIVAAGGTPDNDAERGDTSSASLLRRWLTAAILPRLVAGLALAIALCALLLEVDAGQSWLGLASIALVLVEIERRIPARSRVRPLALIRVGVRGGLAVVAMAAAAVALPLPWWLPMALTVGVVRAAQALRGRMVILLTAGATILYLGVVALVQVPASAHESANLVGLLPELLPELAVGLVMFPTLAALVYRWSSRSRVAISTLQRAVGDLKVASGELRRSQLALEQWNADLRYKVEQQTKTLEERNRHLSIINAVSFALAEPMDDEQALERAVRLVARLLGVRAAQAYTEPRPGQAIALFVTVAPEDVYAPRVPEMLLRTVATTGRPLSSHDGVPQEDSAAASSVVACKAVQVPHPLPELGEPYVVVPLVAKGRVLGSFALVGTGSLWGDDDGRHLLLLVGREMGIAIENARLFQEAVEKAGREEFLTEVTRLLNASDRGERAVPAVLEAIRDRIEADEVLLVMIPGESRDVIVAGAALADDVKPRLESIARALTRQVSDRYGSLVLGVGGEAPLSDRLAADGVTTVAVVPIYMRRGDIGESSASHKHEHDAAATVPVLTGALAMIVGADGGWGVEDTALLERVADILARRIQADEFVAVQQQRIRELTGLAEVARVMQSGADGERLHHSFAIALRQLLRYEALYIPRLDEARNLLEIPSFGQSGRMIPAPSFAADDVNHPWFSLRAPTQWVRGDSDLPGFVPADTRYALIVPMRPKGQMLGLAIVVLPRPVRSDQAPIVEQAVEQLSLALDGATLYQQATARASHIQALSNLARIVASVVNLREAFAAVSEEVRWLIPFDRAVMFLLDESEALVEPYAIYPDGTITPTPMPLTSSVASIPIDAGTAVAVRRDDPRYADLDWEILGDDALEVAAVPIRHGGKTSAVFALVTNSPGAYRIGDLDALDEIAGLLAVTIDRI
ncbi:MAG: GAF domain-containing protein, partial [Dehalococcoidia bacterium]